MKNDYQQYFYSLFDEDEKFSLSELDIEGESFRLLGGGVKLTFLHEKGYLHKDLHIEHFLMSPKHIGSVGIIDVAFEKVQITPEFMFIDFIPPFISLSKSQFIAFLIGYYKASLFSLNNIRKNYTTNLLLLLGGRTKILTYQNLKTESRYQHYLSYINIEQDHNNTNISDNDLNLVNDNDKFSFKLFLITAGLLNPIDLFSQAELELGFHLSEGKTFELIRRFNDLIENNPNQNDVISPNYTLIKHLIIETKRTCPDLEFPIWENVILLFDLFSKKFDDYSLRNKSNSKYINKSVIHAQVSLIILQQLTPNSRLLESLELQIKARHFYLSWYSSPTKNWFSSSKTPKLKAIKLSDPVSRLKEELKKYQDSRSKLIMVDTEVLLLEFQYLNSLISALNHLFVSSVKDYKVKKVSNLLWSCSYRAITYAKRNSFIFINHLLNQNKSELIAHGLQYSLISYLKSIHFYIQASLEYFSPLILLKGATPYYEHYDILMNQTKLIKEILDIMKTENDYSASKNYRKLLIELKNYFPTDIDSYFSQ